MPKTYQLYVKYSDDESYTRILDRNATGPLSVVAAYLVRVQRTIEYMDAKSIKIKPVK